MIKYLKRLFKTITTVTPSVTPPKTEFIPMDDIQTYLLSVNFIYDDSVLFKKMDTHTIIYNIDEESLSIVRDNSGTIILKPFGRLDKVIRFISKYSI